MAQGFTGLLFFNGVRTLLEINGAGFHGFIVFYWCENPAGNKKDSG